MFIRREGGIKVYIMENPEIYLKEITEKINQRLEGLEKTLTEGVRDIEKMHDYYWENYTEMDEYGYENFDNQQALLTQFNANTETSLLIRRLKKMAENPYFGRVDFLYEDDEAPETFYIGIGNFSTATGTRPLIYDWRAPVSALFYDYDKGPASYKAPAGLLTGEITSKWQYKIRRRRLVYAFECDTKIDDEILRQELGQRGDTALKNLVQTIQKEQNAIIRNTDDRILVIQGAAGSGKTSVALHRVAYLLYHNRQKLKASQVLILSPNGVFTDYISHILPELGEENIRQMSFDTFAYRELSPYIEDCEEHYDVLERMLKNKPLSEDHEYKLSRSIVGDLCTYAAELEDTLMSFAPIKIRHVTMSVHEVMTLFCQKFADIPLLKRMDAVFDYALDAFETLHGKTIPEEEADILRQKALAMYDTRDLYILYSRFLELLGFDALPHLPKEKRFLRYEDVYPMLFLKYLLNGKGKHRDVKHLIIDEMQDYSYLQYRILSGLFACPMTILGDKAQTMDEAEQDVTRFLPELFGAQTHVIVMNKSYRSTVEIGEYAASIKEKALKGKISQDGHSSHRKGRDVLSGSSSLSDQETATELFNRHGSAVSILEVSDFENGVRTAFEQYLEHKDRTETAAVITFSAAEASGACRILEKLFAEKGLDAAAELTHLHTNSKHFRPGLTVTTFYLAKGLEFDAVYALEPASRTGALCDQARYITATRALHALSIIKIKAR